MYIMCILSLSIHITIGHKSNSKGPIVEIQYSFCSDLDTVNYFLNFRLGVSVDYLLIGEKLNLTSLHLCNNVK